MMTTEQFTYWLQGFFEISNAKTLDAKQVQIIKDHLNLVFNKQTPDRNITENLLPNHTGGKNIPNTFTTTPSNKRGPTIYC